MTAVTWTLMALIGLSIVLNFFANKKKVRTAQKEVERLKNENNLLKEKYGKAEKEVIK